jgi:hypothetical protein
MLQKPTPTYRRFACVTPAWDNSPRRGKRGAILKNSSPEAYEQWLRTVIQRAASNDDGGNFVFVNAWNEWAEGNHLEPCQKWGRAYLEATRRALDSADEPDAAAPGKERAVCRGAASVHQRMVQAVHGDMVEILREAQADLADAHDELAEAAAELERLERFNLALQDVKTLIPAESTFILVDQEEWMCGETVAGRRRLPFPERDGVYFRLPEDDEAAIRELERLRQSGASHIVFGWPAFWWLEYYSGLRQYVRSRYRCLLENDRLVAFDLRQETQRS